MDVPSIDVGLRVLAGVIPAMFSLSSYRTLSLLAVLMYMSLKGDVPAVPDAVTAKCFIPVLIGMCNAGGYLFFMMLTSMSGVSIWSSLVGVYIVVPVLWGIFVRGESRNAKKICGIAACLAAALLLGLAQAAGGGNGKQLDTPPYGSALLFLACLGVWGACDSMAAYVNRGEKALHMYTIVLFSMFGFGAMAWICAMISYYITETVQDAGSEEPVRPGFWLGQFVMFIAQFIGILAWFCTIKLGALSEASSFLPLTSLYTILSAILGLIFIQESMPPMGYVGMVAAAVGGLLISTSDGMVSPGNKGPETQPPAAGADAATPTDMPAGLGIEAVAGVPLPDAPEAASSSDASAEPLTP